MPKKLTFIFAVVLAVGLVIAALLLTKGAQFGAMAEAGESMQPPPTSVSTSVADRQTWKSFLRAVGSIEPIQGVVLEAEVPGIVQSIHFENGEQVREGDLLVQFDVGVERAELKAAKATARLAETEFERAQRLRESGNVPQSQLDRASADLDRARAEVENIEAIIDRKTIRAPFDGQVGIRQVNEGRYLAQGAPIVALQTYDQVYVNFTLPQQALASLRPGLPVTLESDAFPDIRFEGALTAISPTVDPITRTVELQGTLDNPDGKLRAGLFVRVEVTLPEEEEVTTVPVTAIIYAPYGNSVYKIEPAEEGDGVVAKQHFVRTGRTRGDFVSVLEGLEPGEEVVSAGGFKLRNGDRVSINNELQPSPELNPTPDNS